MNKARSLSAKKAEQIKEIKEAILADSSYSESCLKDGVIATMLRERFNSEQIIALFTVVDTYKDVFNNDEQRHIPIGTLAKFARNYLGFDFTSEELQDALSELKSIAILMKSEKRVKKHAHMTHFLKLANEIYDAHCVSDIDELASFLCECEDDIQCRHWIEEVMETPLPIKKRKSSSSNNLYIGKFDDEEDEELRCGSSF